MGNDMPYMYNASHQSGSSFDFNPRAYTQSVNYAASLQSEARRSRQMQKGPLVDLNRHPDSWMIVANTVNTEPVSPHVKKGILVSRWIQFALRLVQLLAAVGIFVCTVCIRGTQGAATYSIRIPDAFLCSYAIYHLSAHPKRRTAESAASYHFFSICMDGGLIPFYVYISLFAQNNWAAAVGSDGRWRTFFDMDWQTNIVLFTTFVASAVVAGLHVFSLVLDVLFVVWFRKISKLPPDMNPLEDNLTSRVASKHKHKNSEMSASTLSVEKKHFSNMSGSTLNLNNHSTVSLPKGFSVVESPEARLVPFSHTRADSDNRFSPHTLESARASRAHLPAEAGLYSQPESRASRSELLQPESRSSSRSRSRSRGRPQSQFLQHEPMPDRMMSPGSFFSGEPDGRGRSSLSPAPQAAISADAAVKQQKQSLINDNWYVMDDGSDVGTPVRGQTPRLEYADSVHEYMVKPGSRSSLPKPLSANPPVPPPKSPERFRHTQVTEREVSEDNDVDDQEIGRALTIGPSNYDDAASIKTSNSAKAKYYGDITAATMGIRGFHSPERKALPATPQTGNGRVISRTGIDIGEVSMISFDNNTAHGRRNVSGAVLEEGRSAWDVRRRQVSGTT